MTPWHTLSQNPPLFSTSATPLPTRGILILSIPFPRMLRIAGSRVSALKTDASTTRIAPMPNPINMLNGTNSIPNNAITTEMPLNITARLAVLPARAIASIFSRPRARSSR